MNGFLSGEGFASGEGFVSAEGYTEGPDLAPRSALKRLRIFKSVAVRWLMNGFTSGEGFASGEGFVSGEGSLYRRPRLGA